jgi:hypothetical protein
LREEELKTFDDSPEDSTETKPEEEDKEEKKEEDMDIDVEKEDKEPYLDMDYEFMSYTKIKELGKIKDVFEKDDPFPLNMYSKK